jgi:hypothetical protein
MASSIRGAAHLPTQTHRTQEKVVLRTVAALGSEHPPDCRDPVYEKLHNTFGRLRREGPHDISGLRARLAARVALHNFCISGSIND